MLSSETSREIEYQNAPLADDHSPQQPSLKAQLLKVSPTLPIFSDILQSLKVFFDYPKA